eukprot:6236389-Karenia_brevis.AAC.1
MALAIAHLTPDYYSRYLPLVGRTFITSLAIPGSNPLSIWSWTRQRNCKSYFKFGRCNTVKMSGIWFQFWLGSKKALRLPMGFYCLPSGEL